MPPMPVERAPDPVTAAVALRAREGRLDAVRRACREASYDGRDSSAGALCGWVETRFRHMLSAES